MDVTQSPPEPSAPQTKPRQKPKKPFWRELLETCLITLAAYFVLQSLFQPVRVENISMQPNLYAGQQLMINKVSYFHFDINSWLRVLPWVKAEGSHVVFPFGGPQRGDIVVLEPVRGDGEKLVKRVIGLSGEKIEVRDNQVYINDNPLNEPYLKEQMLGTYGPQIVPENNLFVMGDNRNNSSDSRAFGFVPYDKFVGKADFRFWPLGEGWGIISRPKY
jgi:signal peptidase I